MKLLITFLFCLFLSINNYAQNDTEDLLNSDWADETENIVQNINSNLWVRDSI